MLAIYTRLSKEDKESTSIENQIREGKAFAKDNGFDNIELYNEGQGISGGAEIKDRPQLFKLLQDFREETIKGVWFRNQNRLERNSNTWHIFISEAKKYNIQVYFNDKQFDFDNPEENLFGTITSALNQYQKDLQSAQTKRTLKDNILEGKVWSIVAYGYKSDNGYLAIDEKEVEVVKLIYKLSLSGKGYNYIANHLNDNKVPTRKNKLWRAKTVQGIIKNTLYKGSRVYSGVSYDAPKIIEPSYWQKVNDNLEKNKSNSGKKVDHKYLLKGLIKCGKCGKNYYGRRRVDLSDNFYGCVGKRYREIKCTNRGINIDVLEGFIWNRFFADKRILEVTKDFLKDDEIEFKLDTLRQNKDQIASKLMKLDKERKNAVDLLIKEVINEDEFSASKQRIDKEKNDLKIKLNNLIEQINFYEQSELTKEKVNYDLSNLKNASFNDKKELINKYIKLITIDYKEPYYVVRIEFKINDYYINEDKFRTDFYGNTQKKIDKKSINQSLIENYIIDRSYNVALDVCYNFIHPISKKIKSLSKDELSKYADKIDRDFSLRHNPIIDIENNTISFE